MRVCERENSGCTESIYRINTSRVTPNRNGESVCSLADSGTLTEIYLLHVTGSNREGSRTTVGGGDVAGSSHPRDNRPVQLPEVPLEGFVLQG